MSVIHSDSLATDALPTTWSVTMSIWKMKLLVFLAFYFHFPVWNFHWKVYIFPDEKAGTIYINDEEGLTGEVEKCFGGWICIRPLLPGSSLLNLSSAGRSRVFSPALIYSASAGQSALLCICRTGVCDLCSIARAECPGGRNGGAAYGPAKSLFTGGKKLGAPAQCLLMMTNFATAHVTLIILPLLRDDSGDVMVELIIECNDVNLW